MLRKISIVSIAVLFLSPFVLSLDASERVNYIHLKQLTEKYVLQHERDPVTGREVFLGNGTEIVICSSMFTMLINGRLTTLFYRSRTIKGEIAVSSIDSRKIESLLKESTGNHDNHRYRIKKVVIDPGHGGKFGGARGRNGVLEKNIVLDIALKLRIVLQKKGIKAVMTRTRDVHLSPHLNEDLNRRVAIANREQPDLFISIHANWTANSSARGFEIYYHNNKPVSHSKIRLDRLGVKPTVNRATQNILNHALCDEYQKETIEFAREIQREFNHLPTNNRGIRKANFRVIKKTECPSVLVEVDFLSNRIACKKLCQDSYRLSLARRLSQAILNYQNKLIASEGFTK